MPRTSHNETTVELSAETLTEASGHTQKKARPRVSVRERRFQHPFGESAPSIEFKERGIIGRWFSEDVRSGQVYRAKRDLGWEHVTPDMIANLDSIGAHSVNTANQITRGPRGNEYLMWMPKADYDQIQQAKVAENLNRMKNPNRQKQEMLESYGGTNALGAEFMDQKVTLHANVKTDRERIQRTGELD